MTTYFLHATVIDPDYGLERRYPMLCKVMGRLGHKERTIIYCPVYRAGKRDILGVKETYTIKKCLRELILAIVERDWDERKGE